MEISTFKVFPLLAPCTGTPLPKAFLYSHEAQNLQSMLNEGLDTKGIFYSRGYERLDIGQSLQQDHNQQKTLNIFNIKAKTLTILN